MIRPSEWRSDASRVYSKHEVAAWRCVCAPTHPHVCQTDTQTHMQASKFNYRALRNWSALIGFLSGRFLEMNRAAMQRDWLLISLLNEAQRRSHEQINAGLCPCLFVRAFLQGGDRICASVLYLHKHMFALLPAHRYQSVFLFSPLKLIEFLCN